MPKPTCSIDGCEKAAWSRSWCGTHYARWRNHGDPHHVEPNRGNGKRRSVGVDPCAIKGCHLAIKARDWCGMHYHRWERSGDPEARLRGEVVNGKRVCPRCQVDKTLAEYTPGTTGRCKRCVADLQAEWRARTPGYHLLYARPPAAYFRAKAKGWRRTHPEETRQYAAEYRARKSGATIESFRVFDVFVRDNWICGICKMPIDPSLTYPDPMSVSLDHIIPLSRGGDHSASNTQASHLNCNVRKGVAILT